MKRNKILVADVDGFIGEWDEAEASLNEYDLMVVSTGVEAYETAVYERPGLIVMSVRLPELNGDDCCRRLKAHPELRNIPVVLVADGSVAEELDRCCRAGCEDLLFRPLERWRFDEIIRKYFCPRHDTVSSARTRARVRAKMTVRYGPAPDQKKLSNYSINVSTGGLFIETGSPLPRETPLALEFSLPDQDVPVCCNGRVAWVNSPEQKQTPCLPSGMGVQFLDLSLHNMHLVRSFIHRELGQLTSRS